MYTSVNVKVWVTALEQILKTTIGKEIEALSLQVKSILSSLWVNNPKNLQALMLSRRQPAKYLHIAYHLNKSQRSCDVEATNRYKNQFAIGELGATAEGTARRPIRLGSWRTLETSLSVLSNQL